MPVASIVDSKILCMHGGLSPEMQTIQSISHIQRPSEVPESGILCDLLWSDPEADGKGWQVNERGVSFTFDAQILERFLALNGLQLIVRAHQVVEDGFEFFGDKKLITLFSAPNYCGEFDNYGAVLFVDQTLLCSLKVLKPDCPDRDKQKKDRKIKKGKF